MLPEIRAMHRQIGDHDRNTHEPQDQPLAGCRHVKSNGKVGQEVHDNADAAGTGNIGHPAHAAKRNGQPLVYYHGRRRQLRLRRTDIWWQAQQQNQGHARQQYGKDDRSERIDDEKEAGGSFATK